MRFLGIDVGVTGGIGLIDVHDWDGGRRVEVHDMPTVRVERGGGKRTVYDIPALWRLMQAVTVGGVGLAVIEEQWAFKDQGVSSSFSLGQGLGVCKMALVAAGVPFEAVAPVRWKRTFNLTGSGKGKSRQLASQLFPEIDFGRRKDEGRSEGLLLALYAARLQGKGEATWQATGT
jgi:crossover junction endodeoxyribonuclease RuvC